MRYRRLLWNLYAAVLFAMLTLGGMLWGAWERLRQVSKPAPQTMIAFLDVGSGDSAIIRTVEGRTILFDTGSAASAGDTVRKLHRLGVKSINLLVMAAAGDPSIGAVPAIANAFRIDYVWYNSVAGDDDTRRVALEALRRRHIASSIVNEGRKIQIGLNTQWSVLWPPEHGTRTRIDALVCQLDYGELRVMFDGAASGAENDNLIASRDDELDCGNACSDLVLQIPEGGAAAGTSSELLYGTAPTVAVISCDSQDPPAPITLHRLRAAGVEVRRTDTMGTIVVTTDGRSSPSVTTLDL